MKYNIRIDVDGHIYYQEWLAGSNSQGPIVRASAVLAEILKAFSKTAEKDVSQTISVLFVKTSTDPFRG